MFFNIILIVIILFLAIVILRSNLKKKRNSEEEKDVVVDDKTYTLDMMMGFVKRRLDEITKVNLYDLGLSEEEIKRRKSKKYELKKA